MQAQIFLSPAMAKQLLAWAVCHRQDVLAAANEHTLVIISGTTNAAIAQTLLELHAEEWGYNGDFDRTRFFRGITKPANKTGGTFAGDVVISKGVYQPGKTVFDVDFAPGDCIIKGANAVHLPTRTAGVLIGNPTLGTSAPILAAAVGKKVQLLVPVGVEKRVEMPIADLSRLCAAPGYRGCGVLELPGEVLTETDALQALFNVQATLVAAGGVAGFEGGCYFAICGEDTDVNTCVQCVNALRATENFDL